MSHPLLTKVLGRVFWSTEVEAPNSPVEMVAAMDPVIADRLEAALDVCSECGLPDKGYIREGADFDEVAHEDWMRHLYTPLVDLPADASETRSGVTGPA